MGFAAKNGNVEGPRTRRTRETPMASATPNMAPTHTPRDGPFLPTTVISGVTPGSDFTNNESTFALDALEKFSVACGDVISATSSSIASTASSISSASFLIVSIASGTLASSSTTSTIL